jgi:hypothetical protein
MALATKRVFFVKYLRSAVYSILLARWSPPDGQNGSRRAARHQNGFLAAAIRLAALSRAACSLT